MAQQIKSTNTSQRGSRNNHFGGRGGGHFNNSGQGGRSRGCGGCSSSNNLNTQIKPNASGYYSPADMNKLLFEECDEICKEHKEKLDQSEANKCNLGEISIEHVTAIIGAMQQAQSSNEDTPKDTDNTMPKHTNTGNAFRGKANTKKSRIQ